MKIERYRDQIDQLAPLVIDGSADLADVKTSELVLLVVELHERGQRDAAYEAGRELDVRFVEDGQTILEALEEEARVAG